MKIFTVLKNLALLGASLLAVALLIVALEYTAGLANPEKEQAGKMQLLFPPGSEESFETAEFSYTVSINQLGLRDHEIDPEKRAACRVIALGDSFTYGFGVNLEDTWLKRLETHLQDSGLEVEIINCGSPGAGPADYANFAKKIIPVLKPDLVLVGILQDDIEVGDPPVLEAEWNDALAWVRASFPNIMRLMRQKQPWEREKENQDDVTPPQVKSSQLNRELDANAMRVQLEQATPEARARFEQLDPLVRERALSGNLNPFMVLSALNGPNYYVWRLALDTTTMQQAIDKTAGSLTYIRTVAEYCGAETAVLGIPLGPYVNRPSYENVQRLGFEVIEDMLTTDAPDRGTELASQGAGLPCVTATAAFREQADRSGLFFELDGHLTPEGHALYAETVAPFVTEQVKAILNR
ncbi:MAG: hypothetical protein GXY07_17320 [Candidatus Hydrogenedentes bacterium]|nr:hypothetical protein [Candidatus Hydrogenedentota bacterium]